MGSVPWGTHFCHFFATRDDLLETLVPYFVAGLQGGEQCFWLVAEPLHLEDARAALASALPDLPRYEREGAFEISPYGDWYEKEGSLAPARLVGDWDAKIAEAQDKGFAGLRVNATVTWVRTEDWGAFLDYERELDASIAGKRLIAACSYPLATSSAAEILDVVQSHQLAVVKREGRWEVVEAQELTQAKADLERRVAERTAALAAASSELRDSEQRFFQVAENIDQVFWLADLTGSPIYVNPAYERVFGRDRDELALDPWSWLYAVHPGDRERVRLAALSQRRGERSDETYRVVLRDGSLRWIRDRSFPIRSIDGEVRRIAGFATDVTAEHFAEEERTNLLAREQRARADAEAALTRLRGIQAITDSALAHLGLDDLLHEMLARLRDALRADNAGVLLLDEQRTGFIVRAAGGVDADHIVGQQLPLAAPVAGRVFAANRPLILNQIPPPETWDWGLPPELRRFRMSAAMGVPLKIQERTLGVVTLSSREAREFTEEDLDLLRVVADRVAPAIERARLVETVRAAREEQKVLSQRILTAQEEERRRLAGELHDELGQVLTVVKIQLDSLAGSSGVETAPRQLQAAIESVDQAMGRVRDMALDLHPAVLDDLGLPAALRWYVDRFARVAGLVTHLSIEPVPRLAAGIETACFRIAQEALTNVARHARAHALWLELHDRAGWLELIVRDDGVGFDVAAARERGRTGGAMGLLGMEERATMVGGELRVRSDNVAGTEVRARLPLPGSQSSPAPGEGAR